MTDPQVLFEKEIIKAKERFDRAMNEFDAAKLKLLRLEEQYADWKRRVKKNE